jgi:hypothetical protein
VPVNIVIGLVALLVALVLYSVGVFGAFRAKAMSQKHVRAIIAGLLFDMLATAMMAIQARGLENSLHTYLAFVAFFGMLAVGVIGSRAVSGGKAAALTALSRWSLLPYAIWIAVFVWGMVERAPARM